MHPYVRSFFLYEASLLLYSTLDDDDAFAGIRIRTSDQSRVASDTTCCAAEGA